MSDVIDAKPELPSQITVDLSPPISFDNREYAQLILKEPRAADMLAGDEQVRNGSTEWHLRNRQIHLIAKVAGVPAPVVLRLPMRQFNEAWGFIVPFYYAGLPTGGS